MPSHEHPHGPEREPVPYQRASRFPGEQSAGTAYAAVDRALFVADCDLSAFRFHLNRVYHVAVLGEVPPAELAARIDGILAAGEPVTLPHDVLELLVARRAQQRRLGPWVERHHRPGTRLGPDR